MKHNVYIGLGSNLGDRLGFISDAVRRLEASGFELVGLSKIIETPAAYVTDQPDFLNACAFMRTELDALESLATLLGVELAMGRVRTEDKGPRNIDLDLLYWNDAILETENLTLPHPSILERDFVLIPLQDVAGDAFEGLLELSRRQQASRQSPAPLPT
jgi:2-amino-4-hydroxy-6-hydroxymethyldihydropteridine diphosphokinase